MVKEKMRQFFSYDRQSPEEREVRRRLTWRVIMLSVSPVPFLLLLIYFIYLLAVANHESILRLHEFELKTAQRLKCLEEKLQQFQQQNIDRAREFHQADDVKPGQSRNRDDKTERPFPPQPAINPDSDIKKRI